MLFKILLQAILTPALTLRRTLQSWRFKKHSMCTHLRLKLNMAVNFFSNMSSGSMYSTCVVMQNIIATNVTTSFQRLAISCIFVLDLRICPLTRFRYFLIFPSLEFFSTKFSHQRTDTRSREMGMLQMRFES